MRRRDQWVVTVIFIAGVLLSFTGLVYAAGVSDVSSKIQLLSLPEGDAARGREAFISLKCNSCHAVAGDKELATPTAQKPGPVFGVRQSRYKPNFIADSIIFPSHAIQRDTDGRNLDDQLSRMGDFSDTITVRQLADVVVYLRSLDNEV